MTPAQALARPVVASEAEWRSAVVSTARLFGWSCWWVWSSRHSPAGFPDLVMLRPPQALFVELKVGRRRPTREQRACLETARLCGLDARVWTHPGSWDEAIGVLAPIGSVYEDGVLWLPGARRDAAG